MNPRDLHEHKRSPKWLQQVPDFKPLKRGTLPKPFARVGGSRVSSTGLIDISATHCVLFLAKDGELLTDSAFYGYMMCRLVGGSLSPLFEFHWHPSHKGFHCKTPCKATQSYTDRLLAQAIELDMKTDARLDPRKLQDRIQLINVFSDACGITLGEAPNDAQAGLWIPR